jgi:hypothetical protein
VYIGVGARWQSHDGDKLEGLCGNFDGRRDNDWVHSGFIASNANEWGNYWKTVSSCGNPGPDFNPCEVRGLFS